MILTERIAQFDRAFFRARFFRNQFRSARFVEASAHETRPHACFKIVIPIGFGFRRELAPIPHRHIRDPESAHDFFDQIDVALEIEPMAWNAPRTLVFTRTGSLQSEALQDFVDAGRQD